MSARDDSRTSPSLLLRVALLPADEEAWREFVDRYGPKIIRWCRDRGLQEADVEDVSQGVLAELAERLPRFHYNPSGSFRGFLRKVVRDAVSDALTARGRLAGAGRTETLDLLSSLEARDDLVRRLEEEFDLELLEAAKLRVRRRVEPRTWEAFEQTAIEGRPAPEVARELGMKVGTLYQAKSSVLRMIQEEVRELESPS